MIVAPARINVSSQLGREENVASLAMLHVTARMVGGHSGWLEVGCAVLLRVQDLTWQDSFGGVRGLDVDWGAGGAPRVCVSEVMLREPGRRERMRRAGPIISALGEQ